MQMVERPVFPTGTAGSIPAGSTKRSSEDQGYFDSNRDAAGSNPAPAFGGIDQLVDHQNVPCRFSLRLFFNLKQPVRSTEGFPASNRTMGVRVLHGLLFEFRVLGSPNSKLGTPNSKLKKLPVCGLATAPGSEPGQESSILSQATMTAVSICVTSTRKLKPTARHFSPSFF